MLKEILNIPDDIPQDLLDKAECIVVLPSVKKGAFGIGGSYGRGVMMCRSGSALHRELGSPGSVRARRRQHRISAGRTGHRLCAAGDESQGRAIAAEQQGETRGRCLRCRWPERSHGRRSDRHRDDRRDPFLFAQQGTVCRRLARRLDSAFRRQRQRKALRQESERERNHPRRQGRDPRMRAPNWFRCSTRSLPRISRIRSRCSKQTCRDRIVCGPGLRSRLPPRGADS